RAEREHIIREQWIKAMELRIIQEQLSKCQKSEGVNHYENCRDWSERYLNMLEDSKVCDIVLCAMGVAHTAPQ
ncbi:hypothetical protein K439DRAFT_1327822, partial [Ramaria rubella]